MGASPTPIWGRVWYHLLCSETDAAAVWYEKMIDAREILRPGVCQFSLYGRIAGEPVLGQAGEHDEPAGFRPLNLAGSHLRDDAGQIMHAWHVRVAVLATC